MSDVDSPARIDLFNNIASFVYERIADNTSEEPATKRRRVEAQTSGSNGAAHPIAGSQAAVLGADAAAAEPVLLEIKDISVSVPQRKKYDLCFTKNFLYARASGSPVPVQGIVYPWKDIGSYFDSFQHEKDKSVANRFPHKTEHAFYLPVPDKSQVQHNYVLLPRNSYLPTTKSQQSADQQTQQQTTAPLEPLVFTIPSTAPKPGTITGPSAAAAAPVSDSYATLFHWALTTSLHAAGNHACELVSSDPKVFHSVARQAYRPQEKAVHVKAFRGSKDGFLFFLPTGILWGFKKPLLFLPLDKIVAVSYTSVLQRTFNIVVELEEGEGSEEGGQEIEFSMLDQEDYAGIDQSYVRRHGLADRSMAEQRKAKKQLAENAKKAAANGEEGEGGEGGEADDGLTELERAQKEEERRLQDEEDEEEEDYDPGSEGESEGSGSSSEEEEEDGEGEGDEDDDEDMGEGLEGEE